MKILYLHQYFVPPAAAGGTRSYEFARRLVARGHEVTLITSSAMMGDGVGKSAKVLRQQLEGIELVVLPVRYDNEMATSERLKAFARFAGSASLEALRCQADVVFATSTPLTVAVPGLLAKAVQRIPMVFEVRDLWPELPIAMGALPGWASRSAARALEWAAYHGARELVALSPGMADGIARRGIARSRITVIPNSCDTSLFERSQSELDAYRRVRLADMPEGAPVIFYGGTFGRINDAGWLVDVAEVMHKQAPDVRFLLVGAGAERATIEQKARALGLLDRNLRILPPVPKHEMPLLLGNATIATSLFRPIPEMWNNSANKFFDALAAGRPIAINYEGWQADLLRKSGAGVVLPQSSPAMASAMLLETLRNHESLQRMQRAASALAREKFDRDKLADVLERVLLRAVAPSREARSASY